MPTTTDPPLSLALSPLARTWLEETIAKQREQKDAWAGRLAMAHTMPRELHALKSFPFEPERYTAISVPVRFLLGEKSVGRAAAAWPARSAALMRGLRWPSRFTHQELMASR